MKSNMQLVLRSIALLGMVMAVAETARVSPVLRLNTEGPDDSLNDSANANLRHRFDAWAAANSKSYVAEPNSVENSSEHIKEYLHRFEVFQRNWHFVHRLAEMKANESWELSVEGPFMDLEVHEFTAKLGYLGHSIDEDGDIKKVYSENDNFEYNATEAVSIDWRERGAVSEIKDQGQCGSCWSFSTTGAVEGVNAINTGSMLSLSEQELVSCDHVDKACNGGEMTLAYRWIMKNGGLVPEKDYPYNSGSGISPSCDDAKLNDQVKVQINGFRKLPVRDEPALQKAVTNHPVSVAVNANQWQFYGGGVFTGLFGFCPPRINHGVLVVGLNMEDNYYIIKNSWGKMWGEQGYIRMRMNHGALGPCGITTDATYPKQ